MNRKVALALVVAVVLTVAALIFLRVVAVVAMVLVALALVVAVVLTVAALIFLRGSLRWIAAIAILPMIPVVLFTRSLWLQVVYTPAACLWLVVCLAIGFRSRRSQPGRRWRQSKA